MAYLILVSLLFMFSFYYKIYKMQNEDVVDIIISMVKVILDIILFIVIGYWGVFLSIVINALLVCYTPISISMLSSCFSVLCLATFNGDYFLLAYPIVSTIIWVLSNSLKGNKYFKRMHLLWIIYPLFSNIIPLIWGDSYLTLSYFELSFVIIVVNVLISFNVELLRVKWIETKYLQIKQYFGGK